MPDRRLPADTELRDEFVRLLTQDGPTQDRRRREFNQAVFFPPDDPTWPGCQVWDRVDLDMVLNAFDKAERNLRRRRG